MSYSIERYLNPTPGDIVGFGGRKDIFKRQKALEISEKTVDARVNEIWEQAPWGTSLEAVNRYAVLRTLVEEAEERQETYQRAVDYAQRRKERKRILARLKKEKRIQPLREIGGRIKRKPVLFIISIIASLKMAVELLPGLTSSEAAKQAEGPKLVKERQFLDLPQPPSLETQPEYPEREDLPFLSPELTLYKLMAGTVPLDEAVAFHRGPQEIQFVDLNTKRLVGRYFRSLGLETENPPKMLLKWLEAVEGPVGQEIVPYILRLGARNAKPFITGKGNFSGVSSPDMQVVELLGGNPGSYQPLLNPEHPSSFHFPEEYNLKYLIRLVLAAIKKETPQQLKQELNLASPKAVKPDLLTGDKIGDAIKRLCAKFETFLVARQLVENYGPEEVLKAYVNNVPLGATKEGFEIFGLEGASRYLLGKSLGELNSAETVLMIGVIQMPAEYLYNQQSAIERARTILGILKKKGKIDEVSFQQIQNELADIKFVYSLPEGYGDFWFGSKTIPEFTRRQIFEAIDQINSGKIPGIARVEAGKIVVPIAPPPIPLTQKIPTSGLEKGSFGLQIIEGPPLQAALLDHLSSKLHQSGDGYLLELAGRKVEIPFFQQGTVNNPGLAIVAFDAKNDRLLGKFDQTNILARYPVLVGSTIKPFIAAFLLAEDYSLTTPVENYPGNYALVHENLLVQNIDALNSPSPENRINLAFALAYSANVPFQKLVKEYLYLHSDGWDKLQNFLEKFGLVLVDIWGKRLNQPTDYAPIGSDAYIGSLTDLARAYGILANPEEYLSQDRELVEICQKITGILSSQQLKIASPPTGGQVWSSASLAYFNPRLRGGVGFFKTGTVGVISEEGGEGEEGEEIKTELLAAGVITTDDGQIIGVATRISGQEGGRPKNLRGVGSGIPLPITREILEYVAENYNLGREAISPQAVVEYLSGVWQKSPVSLKDYQVVVVIEDADIYDRFGNVIGFLKKGEVVDLIGKPKDGFRGVAVHLAEGIITTGFLKSELPLVDLVENPQTVLEQMVRINEMVALAAKRHPEAVQIPLRFIIVGPNERSPFLYSFFQNLKKRNMLMSGIEDMGEVTSQLGIGAENLVWVNGEMLGVYLGDKPNPEELTAPQQVLVEVIIHQEEHVKFQKIVNESGVKVTFSSLFWSDSNEATPAQIVIEALTDYRLGLNTQGSKESEKWGELAKYYSKVYPENALGRIYLLYMRLMDKIDKREPFLRKDAKELVQLLVKLNEKGISIILNQLLAFAVEN